ncbi:bifunctional 2-C-methyl-D-erythritol 4-phosphate cytidylyltransferase/2-C-methyl-D-erythritol 2,4-cyclodiphosphate synthase [Phaeobacter italicus]|uniref:bifunctional 2-C-methyl-D-erythritol 4-phosphate cytidylyltransferase/2-C-methyl-D-erythritol 2,4-cyclodiphosphate synthase n=1 Tax=Phaeobacter italicus TaxID=481446 RepID=UPI00243104D2|nr:bifunctional 2-C-methyl-D-erythritol 4-phosphate cytidylyltransferase/2-C-methyl-D-erythritol 2,4-cyclodiphosphate synthase [Phaeobacter italicus]MCI5101710.1 bifunctional 2-C-methyl-D-erythritol 4-phosphate cytidylyltransferase/2-C-methyl-D-erythritol 2,4-cyclodiphosphate synthase [Phaeobacter italicus]
MDTTAALIVAAGRGTRAGGGVPKQWRPLAGKRVIDWTLAAFRTAGVRQIVLVLSPDDDQAWAEFGSVADITLAKGGQTRAQSVANGLATLKDSPIQKVLIHDAARPCVSSRVIHAVCAALDTGLAAAPALPVTDALWRGAEAKVTGTEDRTGLYGAQTPQGFRLDAIISAHAALAETGGDAADDVEVARAAGLDVAIIPGDPDNMKITRPEDFDRAARILGGDMDVRLGNGYDVHRFGAGDEVILCGVPVAHDRGLQGHSDADVGLHAITDALYGALAEGDIGRHFPPSDPQWKGAASDIFLRHAAELARSKGYQISNVDCTLVCEFPKITPHAPSMRAAVAEILSVDISRVSIKATTSERLGFTGRSEGIAAIATACVVKP